MTLPASLVMPDGARYIRHLPAAQYWRVNHDKRPLWRFNVPEVFRILPFHHVILTEPIQWLWRRINPLLTDDQWTRVLGPELAFTNEGKGFPGHHNYITGADADKDDPVLDLARFCGGAILKERFINNGNLYFEAIDTRKPLPTHYEVLSKPWLYFEAVNIAQTASGNPVIRALKGNWGKPVYVPLLVSREAFFPVSMATKLPSGISFPGPFLYP